MLLLDPKPAATPYTFRDTGAVPNSRLPVVVYRNVINLAGIFADESVRELSGLVRENEWKIHWATVDAVYRYTHYHSTAHEVLVVLEGRATIQLGGTSGRAFTVHSGDVIAIPAGVAHKRVKRGKEFAVAGLYPVGQKWDLNRLGRDAYDMAKKNIGKVSLPVMDPLYGKDGPLLQYWK